MALIPEPNQEPPSRETGEITLDQAADEINAHYTQPPSRLVRGPQGLLMMPSRDTGSIITQEKIDEAREEDYFG